MNLVIWDELYLFHMQGERNTSRVVLSAKVKKEQHALAAFWHPET